MAGEMGLGVIPWSPLGSGVLTGKYTRDDLDHDGGAAALAELEEASAIELGFPHEFLNRPMTRNVTFGDLKIETAAHR